MAATGDHPGGRGAPAVAGGLRERKKRATRELIGSTAQDLFAEHGFEQVTVAQVARAADVAEKTVFNYFPTKEDLVYAGMQAWEHRLLAAIRDRPTGESVLDAFRQFISEPGGLLASPDPDAGERLARLSRVIAASPQLMVRERETLATFARSLAALIADESGASETDVRPRVAANAMIGVHQALLDHVRVRAAAGVPAARLREETRTQALQACALLADGLSAVGSSHT